MQGRAEHTRRKILDAAAEVFDEQGLNGATDPGTAVQHMIDMTHLFGQQLRDNVGVRASHRLVIESPRSQVIDVYRHWLKLLTGFLVAAQAAGDVRAEWEPEAAARLVGSTYLGVQILSGVFVQRADVRDRITDLWRFALLPALVPPERLSRFEPAGTVRWDAAEATEVST